METQPIIIYNFEINSTQPYELTKYSGLILEYSFQINDFQRYEMRK